MKQVTDSETKDQIRLTLPKVEVTIRDSGIHSTKDSSGPVESHLGNIARMKGGRTAWQGYEHYNLSSAPG